eukprot:TRINITY_DN17761_c0_g1_i1.p1 TRINITY_DN17761_c0_g1~~TRINITY_DN17761_c0_g1_i1.p1  ORF type:complete len:388 (-),score=77.29 TRINITY_DN17761_c0_g1_i1:347-1510(-)
MSVPYKLEINLTKSKWTPKHVHEIPALISRAFETAVEYNNVKPLIGTDHIEKFPLKEDSDIPPFLAFKSQMNEAFAEKVIEFKVPQGLMPRPWIPKKCKILAKGNRIAKYFGEDEVSSRNVEVSLKFFDCGHFYLKQSLPGSGAAPYQVCFEGRYTQSDRGFHLEYYFRYTGQTSKLSDRAIDNSISILPPNMDSFVAFCNESDNQLNGMIPAVVGSEQLCRVEIYREPDVVDKGKARFNEDCPETLSIEERLMGKEAPKPKPKPPTATVESTSVAASAPRVEPTPAPASASSTLHQRRPAQESHAQDRSSPPPAASMSSSAKKVAASEDADDEEGKSDDEPMWPLLLGVAVLLAVLAFFAWLNFQDKPVPRVRHIPPEDGSDDWRR